MGRGEAAAECAVTKAPLVAAALAIIGAASFGEGRAHAQPARDELLGFDYDRAPEATSCGESELVRAKIAERLGRDPFVASTSQATASPGIRVLRVRMGRAKRAFTAEIVSLDASGRTSESRTLTDALSCDTLVGSVAFTVAVLLEDLSTPASAPAAPSSTAPNAAPPNPWPDSPASRPDFARPAPTPSPSPATTARRFQPDAALGVLGTVGTAPAVALGVQATVGADFDRLRLELAGRADFPASSAGDVVRTRLVMGRVAPCYGVPVVSGCLLFAAGSLSGEAIGAGVDRPRIESAFYSAGGVALLSRVFIGEGVFVRASAEVAVPFSRIGFDVGQQRVWTLSSVSAAGTLGIGVRLP